MTHKSPHIVLWTGALQQQKRTVAPSERKPHVVHRTYVYNQLGEIIVRCDLLVRSTVRFLYPAPIFQIFQDQIVCLIVHRAEMAV